ncbi:MAG: UDP-N-acetylglucosamine 2-epimerase (hydrolyzing) [Phycisphaerales bacterium]|nr:UDP-N-acetylglucosamine 2-epimerase (hydrolyzing) [Phycisphaerales bacterium]
MPAQRHIVIVTGSRADLGLLAPVMLAVKAHPTLKLSVIVTGAHLPTGTWRDVVQAGLPVTLKIPMQQKGRTGRAADVQALARGIAGLGQAFIKLQPDFVLVLGDRIEALAAGCAAQVGGIRLGHLHGGDRAEGVADESMRHAVSKLAHLHFPASPNSARRLIRMGEDPARVFMVGSPAVDGLRDLVPADDEMLQQLGLNPALPFVMICQHPIGGNLSQEKQWMQATLKACGRVQALVLMPNLDPGREGIVRAIQSAKAAQAKVIDHLPRPVFASVLMRAGAIVGNSSAGLIEAAVLGVPCINIGPRQHGRDKPRP